MKDNNTENKRDVFCTQIVIHSIYFFCWYTTIVANSEAAPINYKKISILLWCYFMMITNTLFQTYTFSNLALLGAKKRKNFKSCKIVRLCGDSLARPHRPACSMRCICPYCFLIPLYILLRISIVTVTYITFFTVLLISSPVKNSHLTLITIDYW